MSGNRQNSRLSQEELDFIKQVLKETQSDLAAAPGRAELDAPAQDPRMLELLQLADELRLQAEVGDYILIFSPTIQHYPDTNTRQFQLGYPTIVEKTGHSRSRRITLSSKDIKLVDKSCSLKNLVIENISATGLALTAHIDKPELIPGKTALTLSIKFPDEDWHECECCVVWFNKQNGNTRLALRFNKLDQQMYEQLNSYVYHNSPDIQSTYDDDDDGQV
jgi:hypothetical protein